MSFFGTFPHVLSSSLQLIKVEHRYNVCMFVHLKPKRAQLFLFSESAHNIDHTHLTSLSRGMTQSQLIKYILFFFSFVAVSEHIKKNMNPSDVGNVKERLSKVTRWVRRRRIG